MSTVLKSKLSRRKGYDDRMLASMFVSLAEHGHVATTERRAKILKGFADSMLSTLRTVESNVDIQKVRNRLAGNSRVDWLIKKYKGIEDRKGGYTSIVKLVNRKGDNSSMAEVSIIGFKKDEKK